MPRNVVLLGDRTLGLLARGLNAKLRACESGWNAVDAGYDTWLVAPRDRRGLLFDGNTAAWGFALSPRVLEMPGIDGQIESLLDELSALASPPTVLFANLFADPTAVLPLTGLLEQNALVARVNDRLLQFREGHAWFHVVDQLSLALNHGVANLRDPRFEATARLYFSPAGTQLQSALWFRALRCLEKPRKKVCVVDLDNTLWGGILGEDGPDGLRMADAGVGMGYRRFQASLLKLKSNGILLAICSKNNPEETMAVLRTHPDCLLRPQDFAHIEIGWGLKSEAIERTARKLGLGLDSFVFIDDSAVERAQVAQALPEVEVLAFPADPLQSVQVLAAFPGFDSLRQTAEDRSRTESYTQEAQRTILREQAASPEEFYRSLGLRMQIFQARPQQADRLHQLLMKTNQFNLTAERIPDEQFRALLSDPAYLVFGLRVSDRFGDSGITGLAIVDRRRSDTWTVRNFLLSCRVIGRTVEHAFVGWLLEQAVRHGAHQMQVRYVRTGRNQVAWSFLESSGGQASESGDTWTFERGQELPRSFVEIEAQESVAA